MVFIHRWADDCDRPGGGGAKSRCPGQAGPVLWSGHGYWALLGRISHKVLQVIVLVLDEKHVEGESFRIIYYVCVCALAMKV